MVNTRNNNASGENSNAGNPSPTLEQVLAMQAQLLQTMKQTMVNMNYVANYI
jgi:hypothetical protein